MSSIREFLFFLREFVRQPSKVGAVMPSSRHLARALVAPFSARSRPANILEVGAGTGAVTSHIASLLGPEDHLDICEVDHGFAAILRCKLTQQEPLRTHYTAGRVRLFDGDIRRVATLKKYDFIISGVPFTAFRLRDVRGILNAIRSTAQPSCTFSYFEYMGLRNLRKLTRFGQAGKDFRLLSTYLDRQIRRYESYLEPVVFNIPPAFARHLRWES